MVPILPLHMPVRRHTRNILKLVPSHFGYKWLCFLLILNISDFYDKLSSSEVRTKVLEVKDSLSGGKGFSRLQFQWLLCIGSVIESAVGAKKKWFILVVLVNLLCLNMHNLKVTAKWQKWETKKKRIEENSPGEAFIELPWWFPVWSSGKSICCQEDDRRARMPLSRR